VTFDQSTARSYAFVYSHDNDDTEVIDVEEPLRLFPLLSRPRTPTEDLTMHVDIQNDGKRLPGWHRAHASELKTSCSTKDNPVPINYRRPVHGPQAVKNLVIGCVALALTAGLILVICLPPRRTK
jgi:hypothetical protein